MWVSQILRIKTEFPKRCLATLEQALEELPHLDPGSGSYDIYRAACIKEFELVLEQSGKLLRKRLRPWFASYRRLDSIPFNDLFRHAAKHSLIDTEACERWILYRDNRNDTAHEYEGRHAEATLKLLPQFLIDSRALMDAIGGSGDA